MDEVIFSIFLDIPIPHFFRQFIRAKKKQLLPTYSLFGCMNATQVLFQLKFTSKQLEKMSKKAERDQHKEEVKA